jgi:hypothetical protein
MTQLLTAPRKSVILVSELPREPFFPLPRRRGDFRLPFAACSQRRRVAIEEADVLLLTTVLRTKLGADTESA